MRSTSHSLFLLVLLLHCSLYWSACQSGDTNTSSSSHTGSLRHASHDKELSVNTSPLVEEIANKASAIDWIKITDRNNVKYRPQNCHTEDDLSFQYKLDVQADTLYLLVEVTDDKILFSDQANITSDHVELWLADPIIDAEYKDRIQILQEFIQNQKKYIAKHKETYPKEAEASEMGILVARDIIKSYQQDKFYVQWVFNKKEYRIYPEKLIDKDAQYIYQHTETGYQFALKLPLQKKLNSQWRFLTKLAYLVDISDIDTTNLSRQECLISSSDVREYAKVHSFNLYSLADTLHLQLSREALLHEQVGSNGHFVMHEGNYEYWIDETYDFIGEHYEDWELLPGKFIPMEIKILEKTEELTLSSYDSQICFGPHQQQRIYSVRDLIDGNGGYDMQVLYFEPQHLLLRVTGASRWPVGPGRCGGGFETNLVYLQFNEDFEIVKKQSHLVESCDQAIDLEYDTGISQLRRISKGEAIDLIYAKRDKKKRLVFDTEQLEKGIQ